MKKDYRRTKATVSMINYHFVFCPRYRRKLFLVDGFEARFKELVTQICEQNDIVILAMECHIRNAQVGSSNLPSSPITKLSDNRKEMNSMEQAIINVEGTTTIETAAAAKKLIEMFGNRNIRAIAVNRVNDKSDEVIVELDFVPGLAPHLHGFTLQVNGLTCGYAGTGPSNLYEVLQAAGVSEAQVAREDITQKSTKTIPLRLERAVTQYGDFQFA